MKVPKEVIETFKAIAKSISQFADPLWTQSSEQCYAFVKRLNAASFQLFLNFKQNNNERIFAELNKSLHNFKMIYYSFQEILTKLEFDFCDKSSIFNTGDHFCSYTLRDSKKYLAALKQTKSKVLQERVLQLLSISLFIGFELSDDGQIDEKQIKNYIEAFDESLMELGYLFSLDFLKTLTPTTDKTISFGDYEVSKITHKVIN